MTDRETLEAVAKGYHDIMELQQKQRHHTAALIRVYTGRLSYGSPSVQQEALSGLLKLADMLDQPRT